MIRQCLVLIFSIYFQDTLSLPRNSTICEEDVPVTIDPKICCDVPPLISTAVNVKCGVENEKTNTLSCIQQTCVFKHHNLMNSDDRINKRRFRLFLDKWAKHHPLWKKAANKAKQRCLAGLIPIQDHICEPTKQINCISGTLYEICPTWNHKEEDCRILRRYMNECYNNFRDN